MFQELGNQQDSMRSRNIKLALRLIQQEKVCLRTQLAQKMKLTPAAITYIINDMMKDRLVKEVGQAEEKTRGRSLGIQLDDNYYRFCSVVIEKHFFRVAQLTLSGALVNFKSFTYDQSMDALQRLKWIEKEVLAMIGEAVSFQNCNFLAIGVAMHRSLLNHDRNHNAFEKSSEWEGINVEKELHAITGLPVFAESAVNCSVLAEQYYGNFERKRNMLLVQMYNNSLEMGIVVNNALYKSHNDFAGQIGHVTIHYKGSRCECGNHGCLKLFCNANLITETYCQHLYASGNYDPQTYPDIVGIADLVRAGDLEASAIVREKIVMLCIGIASVINMFDPEAIVFESELSPCIDYLYSIFREELSRQLPKEILDSLQLIPPSFEHGGSMVYGACALAFSKITEVLM